MSIFIEEPNTNFSNYFDRIIFADDIFEFYYEFIMFWIDDHHDLQLAFDAKNVLSTLTKITNKSFSEIQKNKYLLLKCIVLIACERYRELVLNLRKLVDNLNYDWIEKKLSNEYYNYLEQTIQNNGSLLQFISYLKSDLAKHPRLRIFLIQNSMGYIIDKLHSEKYYKEVVDLYNVFESKELDIINKWFDFAYSLKDQNHAEKAQHAYEIEIKNNPKSSAALNNLGVIFEENGDLEKAVFYFEKARSINQNEELYKRNLTRVTQLLSEKETKDRIFKDALDKLKYETDYAIEKLNNLISAAKKDETYHSGELPIPSWKFAQLISANSQIANSLKDQWLNKGYIFDTGERDEYRVKIYSINPLLEEHLLEIKKRRLDDSWIRGISELTIDKLEELNYFDSLKRLSKIKKKYSEIVIRDYKELVSNYIIGNDKSVVVLAGSIIESLLLYFLEKKSITTITIQRKTQTMNKNIYECDLVDLIDYIESNKLFGKDFYHLTNLSRIYRNYIHPGRELREKEELNTNKAQLCFISCVEIIKSMT